MNRRDLKRPSAFSLDLPTHCAQCLDTHGLNYDARLTMGGGGGGGGNEMKSPRHWQLELELELELEL
jgi:hypothetical protein